MVNIQNLLLWEQPSTYAFCRVHNPTPPQKKQQKTKTKKQQQQKTKNMHIDPSPKNYLN